RAPDRSRRPHLLGPQQVRGRGQQRGGDRSDRTGRDPGRAPPHRLDRDPRRRRGAWTAAGRQGRGHGQGDLGDGGAAVRRRRLAALAVLALLAGGCGGSAASSSGGSGGTLTVFAAASLTNAFTELAKTYQSQHPGWKVRLNFAGSDALAAQIEQGAHADIYAAASPKYPEQLQGEKMLGVTTDFATNTLVLIVPFDNPAGITVVGDIAKGAKLVVGDPAVPIG